MRLRSGNKDYYAFRANNDNFYNLNANCVSDGFIRFPLIKGFRISSAFNMHRLHPVTGRISPHCGVDFAVPVGTPVISVGDGEVIVSKNGGITTGNYIAIRHQYHCMTKYMHLKKVLVKKGQKVKRGERIALSGNTGRSTGPHLHFEVWINNKAVNPLTTKLLNVEILSDSARMKYFLQVEKMLPRLGFY